jgi:hypothetical protein
MEEKPNYIFIDIASSLVDTHGKNIHEIIDKYFTGNINRWQWYYDEVAKAISGNSVIPLSIKKAALEYCDFRKDFFAKAEQQNNEASSKEERMWFLTVQNLDLQNQLTPLLIEESRKKDEIIKQQRDDLRKSTTKTVRSAFIGAILGAVITGALAILQAQMKPDTVVLPSIQFVRDTISKVRYDTIYLSDSLRKESKSD